MKKYIELGPEASILVFSANYKNDETFVVLDELIELLSNRSGIAQEPWLIWYKGIQTM